MAVEGEQVVTAYGAHVAGQVDPLLAVPVGDEAVDLEHVGVEQLGAEGTGLEGGQPEDAGTDRGRLSHERGDRETALRPDRGQRGPGELVEVVRVGAELVGGAGERGRDPGPSSRSSTGSTSWRTRDRVKRGSLLCGSVQKSMPSAAQAASVWARVTSSRGRWNRPSIDRRIPASDRAPDPRASPSSTVSAWSSSVCPSSTTWAPKCSAIWASAAYLASRAAASMPCPPGSTVTEIVAVSSAPSCAICATTRVAWSAEPSWSPWSTVTPMTRSASTRASKTVGGEQGQRVGAAGAGDEHGLTGGGHGRQGASYGEPDRGDRGIERHQPIRAQPWTRAIHSAGSRISCLVGRLAGSAQTALKPSMPTLSTAARTKTAPSRY